MVFRTLVCALLFLPFADAYSVLTHEALIDTAWDPAIKPILQARYPQATPEELLKAHAYAYGGAIIQDLGYYPFGSKFFSDLVHYIRAGDFVEAMFRQSQNVNELAFALGALAHDAADNLGHPVGTNRAVPLTYPKLAKKYGKVMTYEDDPDAHLKVEFGFDVSQIAQHHYAPESYHDFIGFEVSKELLERAFHETYGIELKDVFLSLDLALGTFRWSVAHLIPEMTKAAWALKKSDIQHAEPGMTKNRFVYTLSEAKYRSEWGNEYKKPGFFSRLLAFLFRLLPKVGPFHAFSFKPPGPEAQKFMMESFLEAREKYKKELITFHSGTVPDLSNLNFDTGKLTHYGVYELADKTADRLIKELVDENITPSDGLLQALRSFYNGGHPRDEKALAAYTTLHLGS